MDTIFCIIGFSSLLIGVLVAFFSETDKIRNSKEKKVTTQQYVDTYKVVLAASIIAVLSFILYGVYLYFMGYM